MLALRLKHVSKPALHILNPSNPQTHTQDYARLAARHGSPLTAYSATSASLSVVSGRVAFQFNLHGPTMTLDTACSSSAVAMHAAADAVRLGRCGGAVVGGVNLTLTPDTPAMFKRAGMLR